MTPPAAVRFTGPGYTTPTPARRPAMPATAVPDVRPDEDTRTRTLPPYQVVLHNDEVNTMEFVVAVLQEVFKYRIEQCMTLMLEAHETGRAVVWVGPLEVAELKADQILGCGADPTQKDRNAEPLRVTVEPAPG